MHKVMCGVGTRPEAIKLAPVVRALEARPSIRPILVTSSQHRDLVDPILRWFGLTPDHDLDAMRAAQTPAEVVARVIEGVDRLLAVERPELLIVQGDTATTLAAALAGFLRGVPVAHVEAGLRSGDLKNPFPEEAARRQTACVTTLHFAPTIRAVEHLRREGVPGRIHLTGNTVVDALRHTLARLDTTPVDPAPFGGVDFAGHQVLLITAHRRESWGAPLTAVAQAVRALLLEHPEAQALVPLHPNPTVREAIMPILAGVRGAFVVEPLDYPHFVYALARCHLVLTDSGGVQEEAPALGKPALVMRTTTERAEAVDEGAAELVGVTTEGIVAAARRLLRDPARYREMARPRDLFGDGHAAERIADVVEEHLAG